MVFTIIKNIVPKVKAMPSRGIGHLTSSLRVWRSITCGYIDNAADITTCDIMLFKIIKNIVTKVKAMTPRGIGPRASSLLDWCSIQLSYWADLHACDIMLFKIIKNIVLKVKAMAPRGMWPPNLQFNRLAPLATELRSRYTHCWYIVIFNN